jgi:hypothetical protein
LLSAQKNFKTKTSKLFPLLSRKGALLIGSQSSRRAGNCVVLRLAGLNRRVNLNITKTKTIMKISSSFAKTLAMAGFIGVAAATTQAQSTISWSMDRWGFTLASGNNGGQPVPNTTAGAPGYVAANWNDAWNEGVAGSSSATVNNLWNSSDINSGASITYSSRDLWQLGYSQPGIDPDGTYNREMLNGYLDSGLANLSSTIAISSIPYSSYDIIVYFSGDTEGRAATLTVGSTTYYFTVMGTAANSGASAVLTQATSTTSGSPTADADYAIFTGLSGTSQTIDYTALVDGAGGIAGFQIVAAPEPGSMVLAVMGGFGVLLMRRFKKN